MRFVQRDHTGAVVGHFANPQPFATECLYDDHPDIEAYKRAKERQKNPGPAEHIKGTMRRSVYARGLTRVLATRFGMTETELLQAIQDAGADVAGTESELEP
jgi:hypothetical protein